MPCSSAVTMSLKESDVVHLIPSLQGYPQRNCTEASANTGKLAVCRGCGFDISLSHDACLCGAEYVAI